MSTHEDEKKRSSSPFDGVLHFLEKLGELAERGSSSPKPFPLAERMASRAYTVFQ